MMRIILLITAVILTGAFSCPAQGYVVSGLVVDGSSYSPLNGALISVKQISSQKDKSTISTPDGQFKIEGLQAGSYLLVISHLGYGQFTDTLEVIEDLRLGVIQMEEASIDLDEVEIKDKQPLAIQKGDTTEMDADAYKTLPDANASELVEKMPTVTIQNGRVQAQGEDVQEVLVDGKRFFGNDPMAALSNLPAEVIDKVQIFDQTSEQAQFTGFDDGERIKTMNIITRANMSNGTFGKLYAGYGTDDRYAAGGNIHFFNQDQRISILGLSNNVNQQNFSMDDLLGVTMGGRGGFGGRMGGGRGIGGGRVGGGGGASDFLVSQQNGISTTHAIGINYTDQWGAKVEAEGSYFFNYSDNDARDFLTRDYIGLGEAFEFYTEEEASNTNNMNHRLSGRIEVQLDSMNSLVIRPRLRLQLNDGISQSMSTNSIDEILQSESIQRFSSDLIGLDLSANILWRHKFDRPRRTLSININPSYAPKEGENEFLSRLAFYDSGQTIDTLDQVSTLDLNSWGISANVSYTEPLGRYSMLILDYRMSYQQEDSDKFTFDYDPESEDYRDLNDALSNVFSNDYISHGAGAGINWRKGDIVLTARANLQHASLINEQQFPGSGQLDKDFFNILPMVMMRYSIDRNKNLMAVYRTRTRMPSIEQLQNVIDNSNPLLLTGGNPDLDQSFQHSLFLRYSNTRLEKSSVFFVMLGGSYETNYIANGTFTGGRPVPGYPDIMLPEGAQFSLPVNLDGYLNVRSFVTYGFPIGWISSNLNINLSGTYSRIPGLSNGRETWSHNTNSGLGLVLSSNISEKVDFNISSRSSYNWIRNTAFSISDNNYFQQSSRIRINVVFGPGIVIRNDLSNEFYTGFDDNFDTNYWLWNLSIGKKIFKNQRGELSIVAYDILKQNVSISRNVTDIYVEDIQTNVLQQYFLFKFTYNLRNFDLPEIPDQFRMMRGGRINN